MQNKNKIILLGDSSVGKTALAKKWLHINYPKESQSPTYGAGYSENEVFVHNKMEKIQIWDTAGQEKYRSMAPIYARDAHGVLLVFDLTCKDSFNDIPLWIQSIQSIGKVEFVCLGNKFDLPDREVSSEEALNYCQSLGIDYFETSAETGFNVDAAFMTLIKKAVPKDPAPQSASNIATRPTTGRSEGGNGGKKACC